MACNQKTNPLSAPNQPRYPSRVRLDVTRSCELLLADCRVMTARADLMNRRIDRLELRMALTSAHV